MNKIFIQSLLLSFIFVFNLAWGQGDDVDVSQTTIECVCYRFEISNSHEEHARYGGHTLVLQNKTGNPLEHLRILSMSKKDPQQPFSPGNVTEALWRFSPCDAEVVLPLPHLAFSLVIYAGDFDDETPPEIVLREKPNRAVLMLDGETFDGNIKTVNLTVCLDDC